MILTNQQIRIKLLQSLKNSFFSNIVMISFVLLLILIVTAFSLITVRFDYKLLLDKQKNLVLKEMKLNEQWSQIVLEYSSLSAPTAVETFAEKAGMSLPNKSNIKFINVQKQFVK